MSVPASISYRNVKPVGIPSRVKKVAFTPHNVYNDIRPNDVVRFHIKAPTFWDPYNCYVKLKVDFSEMEEGVVQQIDSSAQSFISEMIVSAGNQEIERIQEYDVLAAMLMDVSYDNAGRLAKQHEGLSSEILPSNNFNITTRMDNAIIYSHNPGPGSGMEINTATHGFKPTLKPQGNLRLYNQNESVIPDLSGTNNKYLGALANPVNIIRSSAVGQIDNSIQRADKTYMQSRRKGHPGPFLPIYEYPINVPYSAEPAEHIIEGKDYWNMDIHNPAEPDANIDEFPTVGNINVFTKEFASGCFEDVFSKSDWEYMFKSGKVSTPIKEKRTHAEYIFPLLSGVLGILMPRDNYKLFPAFAVDNLTVEFRVNPHAVFTGGYINPPPDIGQVVITPAKTTGTGENAVTTEAVYGPGIVKASVHKNLTTQAKRTFKIIEFEIIADLVQFDESVTELMRQQLSGDGIVLASHSWSLGPLYNIKDTSSVLGTWSLNMGFESLKAIYLVFLSNDYMQYSFCRKNYRLSRNITSIQTKVGLEWFPDKPLEGHGGNPYVIGKGGENNWVFLYELWKTFGHMNDVFQHHIINRHNFAINERPYDVTNTEPYMLMFDSMKEHNIDTAMGYPLIHENRMVGRAIYVLNYTHNSDGGASLNGINTIQNRPFDIIIKTDTASDSVNRTKDRPCTMMSFCHYDFLIQITLGGVRVLGRA